MVDNKKEIVRKIAKIFCPMSKTGISALAEVLVPIKCNKNDIVLKEGDVCRYLYFVDQGMVRQFYYKNGREVTEHFSYEGRFVFCIESFLTQKPSRILIEALEPTKLYGISYEDLQSLITKDPEVDRLYHRLLEHVAISGQQHADSQRFETASERYDRLLHEKPEIVLRAPMLYIASYLQMTPETLSRVRKSQDFPE